MLDDFIFLFICHVDEHKSYDKIIWNNVHIMHHYVRYFSPHLSYYNYGQYRHTIITGYVYRLQISRHGARYRDTAAECDSKPTGQPATLYRRSQCHRTRQRTERERGQVGVQ
jgi:hypothetical protein